MIALFLASFAFGHGGEDHGAPPPSVTTSDANSVSVTTSSTQFEGVFRVKRGPIGSPVATTLLLDDFATSAPISDATVSVALQGPGSVEVELTPGSSGTYVGTATFPLDGDYAGALVVTTPSASDLLSLTGLHIGDAAPAETGATSMKVLGVLGGVALLGIAGLAALGIGYAIGRRRGAAAAALLLAASAATRQVSAHGGEDHGTAASAVAADTSGALHLPMESQFLVGLRTSPLVHDTFQERVPALGRFVARAGGSATLRAPVAGELTAPQGGFPPPGTTVHAGQLLGTIRGAVGSADRAAIAG